MPPTKSERLIGFPGVFVGRSGVPDDGDVRGAGFEGGGAALMVCLYAIRRYFSRNAAGCCLVKPSFDGVQR